MEELFDSERKLEDIYDERSISYSEIESVETNRDMPLSELAKKLYLQKTRDVGMAYERNLRRLQEVSTPFSILGNSNLSRELFMKSVCIISPPHTMIDSF